MKIGTLKTKRPLPPTAEDLNALIELFKYSKMSEVIKADDITVCAKSDPDGDKNSHISINIKNPVTKYADAKVLTIQVYRKISYDTDGTEYHAYDACFNVLKNHILPVSEFYKDHDIYIYGTDFKEDILHVIENYILDMFEK